MHLRQSRTVYDIHANGFKSGEGSRNVDRLYPTDWLAGNMSPFEIPQCFRSPAEQTLISRM